MTRTTQQAMRDFSCECGADGESALEPIYPGVLGESFRCFCGAKYTLTLGNWERPDDWLRTDTECPECGTMCWEEEKGCPVVRKPSAPSLSDVLDAVGELMDRLPGDVATCSEALKVQKMFEMFRGSKAMVRA